MSGVDPNVDPSEHHDELIEQADEPAVLAAEELEAQQARVDHEQELARLDAAKARAHEPKAPAEPHEDGAD